ncbi:hypothetical protein HanIR_Chr01g0028421 [Helianthus annuus]|nr:hypothetical protein HanIR_Chr01g0028421 [Helianthus annuus]
MLKFDNLFYFVLIMFLIIISTVFLFSFWWIFHNLFDEKCRFYSKMNICSRVFICIHKRCLGSFMFMNICLSSFAFGKCS